MQPSGQFDNHYAFLVGIDQYDHFTHLRGAHSDAATLRETLRWIGYPDKNVRLVLPEKTTLSGLKAEVDGFLKEVRYLDSNPDIVVFWAGHGVPTTDSSFLIARNTERYSENWPSSALSLTWLANQFREVSHASLTMLFDVCHSSIPSEPEERRNDILNSRMSSEVRTTFVGVWTFAYEVWNQTHEVMGKSAGILADAAQKAICGEPCGSNSDEHCHDDTFAVMDDFLVQKLKGAVSRKARATDVRELLSVITHHRGPSRKIGFAVRSFAQTRLNELRLPVATELLAKLVLERSGPFTECMTVFGVRIAKLTRTLIDGSSTIEDFLQEERKLTCKAILELRNDHPLGPYSYFLLHCREEAGEDETAERILRNLYKYLILGGCCEELANWLNGQYQMFLFRQALPWSCGIRVLDEEGEYGYAPIIYQGAPIAVGCEVQRTFVTTSPLQRRARLEVWRADSITSSVRNLPEENQCYSDSAWGDFSVRVPIGGRVWVRFGLDEQGCNESCPTHNTSLYVPMKIALGRERHSMNPALRQARCRRCQGPAVDHEWCGHWHLDFGESSDEFSGPHGPEPEPTWVARLRALMDDCHRSLEALLANDQGSHQQEQDDAATLIKWLYLADVVTRMWDRSRLEYVTQELIIGLRVKKDQSTQRLAGALHTMMSGRPEDGGDRPSDQAGESAHWWSAEDVLTEYEQWRIGPDIAPEVTLQGDLLARLLRAVIAQESATRPAVEQLVELLVAAGPEEENQVLADAVAVATPSVPARARQAVAVVVSTVEDLLRAYGADLLPEQRAVLASWAQIAGQALNQDQSEESLDEFLAHLRRLIGMGAWVLATAYLDTTGLHLEAQPELNELVTSLRLGYARTDTRHVAEETYRRLQQLHIGRLRDEGDLERGTGILLMFHALLWPGHAAFVMQLGTRDIDQNIASRIAVSLADPDRPDLIDMLRVAPHGKKIIRQMAIMGSVQRLIRVLGIQRVFGAREPQGRAGAVQPERPEPPTQAQIARQRPLGHAEWHDRTLLAIPPGERHSRSASVSHDS